MGLDNQTALNEPTQLPDEHALRAFRFFLDRPTSGFFLGQSVPPFTDFLLYSYDRPTISEILRQVEPNYLMQPLATCEASNRAPFTRGNTLRWTRYFTAVDQVVYSRVEEIDPQGMIVRFDDEKLLKYNDELWSHEVANELDSVRDRMLQHSS